MVHTRHHLLLLLSAILSGWTNAQVVQVPIGTGCLVVVAGTGGNVALNRVGMGGIVLMKDPFDDSSSGGNFTFIGPTVNGWNLLGDLSFQTTASQAPPLPGGNPPGQVAGTVTTVNIQSYNKNLRSAELSAPNLARSKGRVSVRYKSSCDSSLVFDVYKEWRTPVPAITGVNCWPIAPQPVTFSVDPLSSDNVNDQIGFDQYYWKCTNGGGADLFATLNSGYSWAPDRSSVTLQMSDPAFQAWYTGGPYTLQCCFGRCNPWDGGTPLTLGRLVAGTTCAIKSVGAALVPAYVSGFPTCVNAVAPTVPITITSTNYNGAYTYSWSRTNNTWAYTPNASGGLAITGIGDGNPCTFILSATPVVPDVGCAATFVYTINRNYNDVSMLAAPGTPFCASTGTFTVNLGPGFQGNSTCWGTLPGGWSAVNPTGVPSAVQFTIPAAAAGTTANITLRNCASLCTTTIPIVINVRPGIPTIAPVIPTTTCVPSGGGATQNFLATSAGAIATGYSWSNTMGMTEIAPTNDATGAFNPTGTAFGSISVQAQNVAGCFSTSTPLNPYRTPSLPTTAVVQPCYNLGVPAMTGNATFTIVPSVFTANGPGVYLWTFPPNSFFNTTGIAVTATVNSNGLIATNTQVSRPTTGIPGSYTFTVRFTPNAPSTCTFVQTTFTTIRTTLGISFFDDQAGAGPGALSLSPPTAPLLTTYQAYNCNVPIGPYGTIFSSNSITLGTLGAGNLTMNIVVPQSAGVIAPAPANCTWRPACVPTTYKRLVVVDDNGVELTATAQKEAGLKVMPNPNDGTFTLYLENAFEVGNVSLWDASGKMAAASQRVTQGNNDMRYDDLPAGMYTLRVELDGQVKVQRVVVMEVK